MNDITRFTSSMAESYAETINDEMVSKAKKVAASYIKYLDKRYEKAIKSSLKKDSECKSVKFRMIGKKVENNILKEVRKIISDHFKNLGFGVSLIHSNGGCICLFNRICNCDEIKIFW